MRLHPSAPSLVEQMIPQRSLAVIYGEPGAGKSFLVLDLACSIAAGIAWHGRNVHRGPVVYVAAEGSGGIPARLTAWEQAHGAEGALGVHFLPEPVRLVEQRDARELVALLKALPEPPVLVIFDTLARSMAGSDENSGKDMGILIDVADQIRVGIGCTVLFVHHPTKGDRRDERGSGQLRGAADMMAVVVRKGSTLTIESEKPKDYARFSPMSFELVQYLDSCVVVPLGVSDSHESENADYDLLSRKEHAALLVLVNAGTERSIVGLRWEDFDFAKGTVLWRSEHDKKGKEWLVPMPAAFMEEVKQYRQRFKTVAGPLFPRVKKPSEPMPAELLTQWLAKAEASAKLAKLAGSLWHAYRRKFATERMHHPLRAVADAGGWKDVATLLTCYQQTDETTLLAVMSETRKLSERRSG